MVSDPADFSSASNASIGRLAFIERIARTDASWRGERSTLTQDGNAQPVADRLQPIVELACRIDACPFDSTSTRWLDQAAIIRRSTKCR